MLQLEQQKRKPRETTDLRPGHEFDIEDGISARQRTPKAKPASHD